MSDEQSNESLLREGECQSPYCIELEGHAGSHSGERDHWARWLTEKERHDLHSCDPYDGDGIRAEEFARSLAASRALVAEKDKALAVIEDMTTDYLATDKAAGHVARAANAALALTEADMLKRLEVK